MGELQDKIIAEARTWIGTRFHHLGFKKGVGCDCAGLIRGTVEAVTGDRYVDAWVSSRRPHAPTLIKMLNKYFTRIHAPAGERLVDCIQPGDILLFNIDNNPQHLAIKTDRGIIHSYALGPRRVEEVSFASPWPELLVGVWRLQPTVLSKSDDLPQSGTPLSKINLKRSAGPRERGWGVLKDEDQGSLASLKKAHQDHRVRKVSPVIRTRREGV